MAISKRDARQTSAWWQGRTVANTRPLGTTIAEMPPGTRWTVQRKYSGLHLQSHACPCCGIRVSIPNVPFSVLELIQDNKGQPEKQPLAPQCRRRRT